MLLKEFLEPLGVTQKAFAKHLGWTYARLNEIINGRHQSRPWPSATPSRPDRSSG